MKYIKQLTIILLITFIAEAVHTVVPLPVPATIYGMILLFILLATGVLRVEQIKETSAILIRLLPLFLVSHNVGLLSTWSELRKVLLPFCFISAFTTFLVMIVSGRVSQFVIRLGRKKKGEAAS